MPKQLKIIGIILLGLGLWATSALAIPDATTKFSLTRDENPKGTQSTLVLPYAFSTDSLGTTVGLGGMMKGYGQEQLLIAGTVMTSSDDAVIGLLGVWDYQLPVVNRFFFSTFISVGYYPEQRAYTNEPLLADLDYSGGNDSDKDDYIEDSGTDNIAEFKLEYILPIGAGRESPMQSYTLKGGILQSGAAGGETWDPLHSGTTVFMLKQYNRYQSFELEEGTKVYTVHPITAAIYYDNTDFPVNPSSGSSQYVGYTKDFGWKESREEWDFVEFESSTYFDLGRNDFTKQQTLALNFWTGYSASYEAYVDGDGVRQVSGNPPFTQGSTLGGIYRMRAYSFNRFNDSSVIYATGEYRWTPEWNPIADVKWLKFLQLDWLQLVPFVEVGRVSHTYNLAELFSDLKVDGGLSVRAMTAGTVVRCDFAVSDEGSAGWVMFGHPF